MVETFSFPISGAVPGIISFSKVIGENAEAGFRKIVWTPDEDATDYSRSAMNVEVAWKDNTSLGIEAIHAAMIPCMLPSINATSFSLLGYAARHTGRSFVEQRLNAGRAFMTPTEVRDFVSKNPKIEILLKAVSEKEEGARWIDYESKRLVNGTWVDFAEKRLVAPKDFVVKIDERKWAGEFAQSLDHNRKYNFFVYMSAGVLEISPASQKENIEFSKLYQMLSEANPRRAYSVTLPGALCNNYWEALKAHFENGGEASFHDILWNRQVSDARTAVARFLHEKRAEKYGQRESAATEKVEAPVAEAVVDGGANDTNGIQRALANGVFDVIDNGMTYRVRYARGSKAYDLARKLVAGTIEINHAGTGQPLK